MTCNELDSRKKGYRKAMQDIKEMGLKCTGIDPCFTVGYGEAIVEANMRAEAAKM